MRTQIAFRRSLVLLLAAGMGVFLGCSEDGASTAPDNSGTLDTVAPLAPVPAAARVKSGALSVSWLANGEPDVLGYNVYVYRPDPLRVSAYIQLNSAPVPTTDYLAAVASSDMDWLRVSAVDRAGNESALSVPFSVDSGTHPEVDGGPEMRHDQTGLE